MKKYYSSPELEIEKFMVSTITPRLYNNVCHILYSTVIFKSIKCIDYILTVSSETGGGIEEGGEEIEF